MKTCHQHIYANRDFIVDMLMTIFCFFKTRNEAVKFFDDINIQHPNITFTLEEGRGQR